MGKAQREASWRHKSNCGKSLRVEIPLAAKSRGPNSNTLAYTERALST